jgi:hypothetical protein
MLEGMDADSPAASNSCALLAMSEEALQQILEHREFMARVIELCGADS